jgi:hypothetical protein
VAYRNEELVNAESGADVHVEKGALLTEEKEVHGG